MKEFDLLCAMTDLDDELLEWESGGKVRRFWIGKVAAFTAALALMTVTVFAAVGGIRYWFGLRGEGGSLNVRFPLEPVTIRQEAYEELSQTLERQWEEVKMPNWQAFDEKDYEEGKQTLLGTWGGEALNQVDNLEELEEYLGVELVVSPEMAQMIELDSEYNFGEALSGGVLLRGASYEDALKEYEATGSVTLHGIEINLCMNQGTGAVTYVEIIIPLTQDYMKYYPTTWVYSFEKEGETYEYSNGSRDFVIAKRDFSGEYGSHYGSRCVALYGEGGIGYYVNCIVDPSDRGRNIGEKEAEEIVLPLIGNIK